MTTTVTTTQGEAAAQVATVTASGRLGARTSSQTTAADPGPGQAGTPRATTA